VTDWSSLIVAKLSPWIQLDSSDPVVRRNSEKVSKGSERGKVSKGSERGNHEHHCYSMWVGIV